jgi:hypothetical protein
MFFHPGTSCKHAFIIDAKENPENRNDVVLFFAISSYFIRGGRCGVNARTAVSGAAIDSSSTTGMRLIY